ncbi:spermatogenesis associated multipass transmembrane protein 3 [Rattus norvegicus]|uniref:Spermatogenesis associated multipass transmembrane protein 3 n=2 Tax=Rattus norvegicus TaxID=10116 RepID=F1M0F7_RAT|nr:spermatogenesis associated multipass transmembrane protein 3 [Rattus norvegicus]|eukprot:XP_001060573.3 PREDICTED: uncharacterized protein Samt3 [Rattus norvegicus]
MDFLTCNIQRFAVAKECIFKLSGLVCSLIALVFEIILASSRCWRLWEFDSKSVQFVFFGLWEAYYPQSFNISGSMIRILVHSPINSTWTISPEFHYAQTLIIWAVLLKPAVLIFSAMAIKIGCMKDSFVKTQIFLYKTSALILCISSLCTFVSVSWNHIVDLYGQTTLDFPPSFPVKKDALIKKHYTAAFPIGVLTATMSLFGVIMFLFEMSSLKPQSEVEVQCVSRPINQKA